MPYKVLADVVVLVHFVWILFLFLGGLWGVKRRVVRMFHLLGLLFALIIQAFDWYCPLTDLEIYLRSKHSPTLTYTGSFIIHYLEKIVYIEVSRPVVLVFTFLLCGFNGWLYLRRKGKEGKVRGGI